MKIEKIDIKKIIVDFPKQFQIGWKLAENIKLKKKFKKIFIAGMGGSALPGEILKIYFEEKKIKVTLEIIRDYDLPLTSEKDDLIFCISYSGNTEETISVFQKALKKNLKLVSITSGGKLFEISKRKKILLVKIPKGLPPRFALGYLFSALFRVLINSKVISEEKPEILELEKKLKIRKLEKEGKILAEKIKNKIPLIYSSRKNFPLAKIWKIKFNENSKIPAFCNFFPELNHNEMVGFTKRIKNFAILIIRDRKDSKRNQKRMRLFEKILKERGYFVKNIDLKEKGFFEKIFSNILLAIWTSYYLASIYKVDPVPVKIVEEFKKLMKK